MRRIGIYFCLRVGLLLAASTAEAVEIDPAIVGNPGNAADDTVYGSVDYFYGIGRYEVTNAQYCEFLNSVAASDPNGLYNTNMGGGWNDIGGIRRSGSDGPYTYAVRANRDEVPAAVES